MSAKFMLSKKVVIPVVTALVLVLGTPIVGGVGQDIIQNAFKADAIVVQSNMMNFGADAVYAATVQQPIRVFVDGQEVHFPDQKPYIDKNNRTLVPVRFVSEALGAKVDWDGNAQQVSIEHKEKGKTVKLWVGKDEYLVNGKKAKMDTKAVLTEQARVMVPLRFVSEALGAKVHWEVVGSDGVVFTFTLDQSQEEMNRIIEQIKQQIIGEKPVAGDVTIIPDSEWSYDKPKVGVNPRYFNDPNVKIAYATVDQFPIKTKYYTIKNIELTDTHIIISYDTFNKVTPKLYITQDDYLWVRNSYISGKTHIDYKYPIESYGEDDNPLRHKKLKEVDYLNIVTLDTILAIENPFKEGR